MVRPSPFFGVSWRLQPPGPTVNALRVAGARALGVSAPLTSGVVFGKSPLTEVCQLDLMAAEDSRMPKLLAEGSGGEHQALSQDYLSQTGQPSSGPNQEPGHLVLSPAEVVWEHGAKEL